MCPFFSHTHYTIIGMTDEVGMLKVIGGTITIAVSFLYGEYVVSFHYG